MARLSVRELSLTLFRYTVLVRKYQSKGITLPSVASSPSVSSRAMTPLSFHEEEKIGPPSSSTSSAYQNFIPQQQQLQPTTSDRHRSWSSPDSDAYSAWSSPQSYTLSIVTTRADLDHAIMPMSQFAFTQPPDLGSNAPTTSASWDWTTPSMSAPVHGEAPMPQLNLANHPYYGYDNYSVFEQLPLNQNPSYTPYRIERNYDTLRERSPTNLQEADTIEEHHYDSNEQGHDPRFDPTYSLGYQF